VPIQEEWKEKIDDRLRRVEAWLIVLLVVTVDGFTFTAIGGGGGGGEANGTVRSGASGGSGVCILSIPTAKYSGITTGSPTVTTSGSNTILVFNSSGSYTA